MVEASTAWRVVESPDKRNGNSKSTAQRSQRAAAEELTSGSRLLIGYVGAKESLMIPVLQTSGR